MNDFVQRFRPIPSRAATITDESLLSDIRSDAALIATRADRTEFLASRDAQIAALEDVKGAVNDMGLKASRLSEMNAKPNLLWLDTYREMTVRLHSDAANLSQSLDAYNRLDTLRAKERDLESDIGTAAD